MKVNIMNMSGSEDDILSVRCSLCKSDNVEQRMWVRYDVGTDTIYFESPEPTSLGDFWCNKCGDHKEIETF